MGYPEFKFTVDISYQDVAAFGPLIVPIIPTPWDSSINLRLEARVYTEAEIKIDLSKWKITTGGASYAPENAFVVGLYETPIGKVKLEKNSSIIVVYPLKAADIDSLSVDFGSFF
mgnify:CR=1 FL=1